MKKTLIVIVMLCMVFILGCTSDAINPTAEPTDSPTSPTINAATPSPTVNLGGEFTPTPSVRFCDEPDEYIRLEQFLRGFDFGDAERLELYPKRLNDGLLRASFYDKPVEAALVLLCETSDLEYLDIDLPGSMDHYTGLHAVNLRQLEINPKYDSKANNDEPYYMQYVIVLSQEGTFAAYYNTGDTDCHYVGYYTFSENQLVLNSVVLTGNDPSASLCNAVFKFKINNDGTFSDNDNNKFTKIVAYPGMMLQKFTTKEPDDEQLEVALTALKAVINEK